MTSDIHTLNTGNMVGNVSDNIHYTEAKAREVAEYIVKQGSDIIYTDYYSLSGIAGQFVFFLKDEFRFIFSREWYSKSFTLHKISIENSEEIINFIEGVLSDIEKTMKHYAPIAHKMWEEQKEDGNEDN